MCVVDPELHRPRLQSSSQDIVRSKSQPIQRRSRRLIWHSVSQKVFRSVCLLEPVGAQLHPSQEVWSEGSGRRDWQRGPEQPGQHMLPQLYSPGGIKWNCKNANALTVFHSNGAQYEQENDDDKSSNRLDF